MGRTRGDRRGSWDPSDDRVFSSVAETLARDAGPVEELARRAAESFAAPLAASTAAFLVTARLARRSAYALGVSCATPMVGAVMSVCAVGGSAALAGQAAREATSWASGAGRGDARVGGRASWLFPSGYGRARADALRARLSSLRLDFVGASDDVDAVATFDARLASCDDRPASFAGALERCEAHLARGEHGRALAAYLTLARAAAVSGPGRAYRSLTPAILSRAERCRRPLAEQRHT